MVYIWQKLWDILIKTTGIFGKTMVISSENLWDILGKNYGIYWAKTIDYIMGYTLPKL